MPPVSPTSTGVPSSRSTATSYSGMGRPMQPGTPAFMGSSITGWLTVSVMPYQPSVLTRKRASSSGEVNP